MWDFLTKKCGIFGIEGGTKLWDFQHRGGDFRPLTSGHTDQMGGICSLAYVHTTVANGRGWADTDVMILVTLDGRTT